MTSLERVDAITKALSSFFTTHRDVVYGPPSSAVAKGVQADDTASILQALANAAASVLSVQLPNIQPLNVGTAGNFPWFYSMPASGQFNGLTYNWISLAMEANSDPATLSNTVFTNLWTQVFSTLAFTLSTTDQGTLNKALQNAQIQLAAIVQGWQSTYGSVPTVPAGLTPVDCIFYTVTTTWATPPTDIMTMQQAPNLRKLLNTTPPSGLTLLPLFANYLNALGAAASLVNQTTMNAGYLGQALAAVQSPTAANGGVSVSGSLPGILVPAWNVNTRLADITNGLANTGSKVTINFNVGIANSKEFSVSVNGSASISIPFFSFFSLDVSNNTSYFQQEIVASSNSTTISMVFPGVTAVSLAPTPYSSATALNWYWSSPIAQAVANGTADVTGFHFSPAPTIDFSPAGPFGYVGGVAISSYPVITITVASSNYQSICKTFNSTTSVGGSFLGIPLASATTNVYSHSASVNESSQTVTITLTPPPPNSMGKTPDQNVAWVLGAALNFPAADAAYNAPRLAQVRAKRANAQHSKDAAQGAQHGQDQQHRGGQQQGEHSKRG